MVQKTLRKAVSISGVGVHKGKPCCLTLHPAPQNFGIQFQRGDLKNSPSILARWDAVSNSQCSTNLEKDHVLIGTVEHLMAAFASCFIDNVLVVLDAPEVPILDGSALPFIQLIQQAEIQPQSAPRSCIHVIKEISVSHNQTWARLSPNPQESSLAISYTHKLRNKKQACVYTTSDALQDFSNLVAPARTFGFLEDAPHLYALGLAQASSLENTVVFDQSTTPLNVEGLRFEDECVRHKVLDVVGDLYLAGHPLVAKFSGHGSGHMLNIKLLHALFSDPQAYVITSENTSDDHRSTESFTALRVAAL